MPAGADRLVRRVTDVCARATDERGLRQAVLAEIRRTVPFDAYAWLLTDPETSVGCAPLADIPFLPELQAQLPQLIRLKYLTRINRWTALPPGTAASLAETTGGDLARSQMWRELLQDHRVADVLSVVFRDRHGCWGFLELWRAGTGAQPFSDDETALVAAVTGPVTTALREAQAALLATTGSSGTQRPGPHVLLLTNDLRVQGTTADADAYLRLLLPSGADHAPFPAQAYNVGAQLLALETGVDQNPPTARTHLAGAVWVTLRAARLAGGPPEAAIAVDIEPTAPAERAALFARAHALSGRERELLQRLTGGADTRTLAESLFVSEHTVQDHLKSVFAKTGTHSRRELVAMATGITA